MLFQCLVSRSGICQAHLDRNSLYNRKVFLCISDWKSRCLYFFQQIVPTLHSSFSSGFVSENAKEKTEIPCLVKNSSYFLRVIHFLLYLDNFKILKKKLLFPSSWHELLTCWYFSLPVSVFLYPHRHTCWHPYIYICIHLELPDSTILISFWVFFLTW